MGGVADSLPFLIKTVSLMCSEAKKVVSSFEIDWFCSVWFSKLVSGKSVEGISVVSSSEGARSEKKIKILYLKFLLTESILA